jgi:hypothetical protein
MRGVKEEKDHSMVERERRGGERVDHSHCSQQPPSVWESSVLSV